MILLTKNNQAVKIYGNVDQTFYSLHIVNAKHGPADEIVVRSARHSTEKGARKWAEKQLNA